MQTRAARLCAIGVVSLGLFMSACLDRELKPVTPCLVSGVVRDVNIKNIDKIDLLFMVDNSNSMAEEQASLREQFPKLIRTLTTGRRGPDDQMPFPPVTDLHLGVVSSDMGTPGINAYDGCSPNGGDDGRLQHDGHLPGCAATYPSFLGFRAGNDADTFANDFACIATLGTKGCGFEQQLEAPLKALWPSVYSDEKGNVGMNPFSFVSTPDMKMWEHGRGDIGAAMGGNGGFLRNDPNTGVSLIAIVVVTDEEDCSFRSNKFLTPKEQLSPSDPLYSQDINLRCFYNKGDLFDVRNRYLKGFQMLRPGQPDLVLFAGIVGVPGELVNAEARKNVDFKDAGERDRYYDNILSDSRMVETIDPNSMPGSNRGALMPSCVHPSRVPGDKQQTAFPPRRIVELAKAFGGNGVIQSICDDDFGPAMDAIIESIVSHLRPVCLPRPLVRKASGLVSCKVVWQLPPPGMAPDTTPTSCAAAPAFLTPVGSGTAPLNDRGGQNCEVTQVPLLTRANPVDANGWYYDDFTPDLAQLCQGEPQRVAFTPSAKPPTGVVVKLTCLNEVQKVPILRDDLAVGPQPEIGSDCGNAIDPSASAGLRSCSLSRIDGTPDNSLFCHVERNICVQACASETDCPPAWVCDTRDDSVTRSGGRAYCVNPTCGTSD